MRNKATTKAMVLGASIILLLTTSCSGPAEVVVPTKPADLDVTGLGAADNDANGVEQLSGVQIVATTLAAVSRSTSVHYTGTFVEPGPTEDEAPYTPRTISVDFHGSSEHYETTITLENVEARMKRDGDFVVISGNAGLATLLGNPSVASTPLCVTPDSTEVTRWEPLLDIYMLVSTFLSLETRGVSFSTGSVTDQPTPNVQLVVSNGSDPSGAATISTRGLPLPQTLAVSDNSGSGNFSFLEWNADLPTPLTSDQKTGCPR